MRHKYNWLPDSADSRDFKYLRRILKLGVKNLPEEINLRSQCSEVENQMEIGSCTANALVGNMEFLENINHKTPADLSRLFIYYNERVAEGRVKEDGGARLRDGIKVLHKLGVCDEVNWPYLTEMVFDKPTASCYNEALKRRISVYESLKTIEDMKDCLASGYPFVFGFKVYSAFESHSVARNGRLDLPTSSETFLGGHAVMAVGYDNSQSRFIVRNSWGKEWGNEGYFTIPYDYLSNSDLASDFWTIQK